MDSVEGMGGLGGSVCGWEHLYGFERLLFAVFVIGIEALGKIDPDGGRVKERDRRFGGKKMMGRLFTWSSYSYW
jgi:hypothetical protein